MKKILCIALILMLFLPAASAESIGYTVEVPFIGVHSFPVLWQDDAFFQSAEIYQHSLCRLSLGMTFAAMDDGSAAGSRPIREFFSGLGFENISVEGYGGGGEDTIGSVLAGREIGSGDSKKTVIAIAVRAGDYGLEWLSNLHCGKDGVYHQGFASAARQIVERVEAYLGAFPYSSPVFWITGYSRGAAAANLAAAFLAESGIGTDETIFAYTFATPRTVQKEYADAHPNIFNLINPPDIVTNVPLRGWGFERFGRSLYFPSSRSDADFDVLLPAFLTARERLSGTVSPRGSDAQVMGLLENTVNALNDIAPDRKTFTRLYEKLLGKFFTGEKFSFSEQAILASLMLQLNTAVSGDETESTGKNGGASGLFSGSEGLLPVWQEHMPIQYAAWMMALENENDLDSLLNNKFTLTNAPGF